MKYFSKKLLGQEIFSFIVPSATMFYEKFETPTPLRPSYILNVPSLTLVLRNSGLYNILSQSLVR